MTTRILVLQPGDTVPKSVEPSALPDLLADETSVVWVDIIDANADDKKMLEDVFRLHPTSIEDMLADAPTPKIEHFDEYDYVVWHALVPGWENADDFQLCDLDLMIGRDYLITSHNRELQSITNAWEATMRRPEIMRRGPAFIAYVIADVLTDRYLPLMKRLEQDIDALEIAILREGGPHLLESILALKDKLQRLRRVGTHQKDVLARLSRGRGSIEVDMVPEELRPFFRDAYDDFVRVVDLNDGFRETVNSAMDAYLGMQGHKLNEIMKVLTLISTIMLPLTFIAGVYGMNFDPDASPYNMPELRAQYGYFITLAVMAVTAVIFLWYFRRKRWL